MKTDETLIEILNSFNRKERFFLVSHALGNPEFHLSPSFRSSLSYELGLEIPSNARCWMDYHLDWLYAALTLFEEGPKRHYPSPNFPPASERMDGGAPPPPENINVAQTEDIDLLIGFQQGASTHLVLVEAKGVTGFGNKQLRSKARKLGHIFGMQERPLSPRIIPHFLLASPGAPAIARTDEERGIDIRRFPLWMKPSDDLLWVQLPIPRCPRIASRYNPETGKPDQTGNDWAIFRGRNLKHCIAEYVDADPEDLIEGAENEVL